MTHTFTATVDDRIVTWRDRKRHLWALGLVVPTLPFWAWLSVQATGLGIFWWTGPI
jgi:alkane 1-monooxygenase